MWVGRIRDRALSKRSAFKSERYSNGRPQEYRDNAAKIPSPEKRTIMAMKYKFCIYLILIMVALVLGAVILWSLHPVSLAMIEDAPLFWEYFRAYFLMAFLSSIGMLQIAVTRAGINRLSIFRRPLVNYIFGALAIVGGFALFYATGDRTAEPLITIHEGGKWFFGERETIAAFIAGALIGLVSTILASSLSKRVISINHQKVPPQGLDALKEMTFLQAIVRRFISEH
jgi:hypothetical protein